MAMFQFSLFSGKRAKPRQQPQKGLKPVWNHSETPSGSPSQTLCSFGYSIIALFCFSVARKMRYFLCFGFIAGPFRRAMAVFKFSLFSGKRAKPRKRHQKGLKPEWNHSETHSGSPSQTLCSFGYSFIALFCFLVAGKMCWMAVFKLSLFSGNKAKPREPQRVWNRLKLPLTAHHLRLYAPSGTASSLWNCRRNL
jgi:hypothetical protein